MRRYYPALALFLFACLIRCIYIFSTGQSYFARYDAAWYNHLAYNIAYHHCFCLYLNQYLPNISRPPLWPFLLSILYLLLPRPSLATLDSGIQVLYARIFFCCLDSLTCILIYSLAKKLFGARIAFYTGILAALYTGLIIYTGWLYTETLYTFLLTAFIYALYQLQTTGKWRMAIIAGLLSGLAMLTRPNGPILLFMLLGWGTLVVLFQRCSWKKMLLWISLIICIATIVVAPWTYRNYQVTHTLVLVNVGEGDVLLGAYNDNVLRGTTGLWTSPRNITPRPPLSMRVLRGHDTPYYTPEDDSTATTYAVNWITHHLSALPRLLLLHWIRMWTSDSYEGGLPFAEFPHQPSAPIILWLTLYMPCLVYLLAVLGLGATWRQNKAHLAASYSVIAFTVIQNLAFYGCMRFRAPIEPLLILLAGGGLWWLFASDPGTLRYRLHKTAFRESYLSPMCYKLSRPILFVLASVNQSFPSGPVTMP